MVIEKIYKAHDIFKELRRFHSGLELQLLSYIASYRICNNLEYDDLSIFQLINQQAQDGDIVAEEFLALQKRISISYFGTGDLDKHGRMKASDARRSAGVFKNEPLIDILFKEILESYLDRAVSVCPMTLMTHYIDKVSYVEKPLTLLKSIAGDIVKRKRFYPQRISHFFTKRSVHSNILKLFDDQFEHIYLLLPRKSRLNADYPISFFKKNPSFQKRADVGFHYSYEAINSKELLLKQFQSLKDFNLSRFVRGHYLRRSKTSDEFIDDMDLIDLTPCDSEVGGFYIPSSYPFYIHKDRNNGNFILNTTFMDVVYHFMDASYTERKNLIQRNIKYIKSNGGFFVVNWHNTSFWWGDWPFEIISYSYLKSKICEYF